MLLVSGCATRSISDSAYPAESPRYGQRYGSGYQGELTEFNVLGIDTTVPVPDENQRMRIRLKVALIDVKTGQWEMFSPEPFDDADFSSRGSRAAIDQAQVALLKDKAYRAAVTQMFTRFSH